MKAQVPLRSKAGDTSNRQMRIWIASAREHQSLTHLLQAPQEGRVLIAHAVSLVDDHGTPARHNPHTTTVRDDGQDILEQDQPPLPHLHKPQ